MVLGMGSLGARRLNATSDLDLIVIYDPMGEESSDGPRPLATRPYFARLTQALAVLARAGSDSQRSAALRRLGGDASLAQAGLSQSFYVFEALMTDKEQYGATVLAEIERICEGKFIYNAENARKLLTLEQEWWKATH